MLNLGTAYGAIEVRLDRLEANLAKAERDFAATGNKLDAQAKKIKANLSQSFGDLGRSLTIGLTAPILGLGTAAVKAAVDMDSLKRGLRSVAGTSQETEAQLRRLKEVAKLPGLGFREAIAGSTRLQAAGLSARQAERALMGFGNALASVGRGKADLDGVITALSQIQSKGVISAEEINQIAERVPQIRRIMQDAFGTSNTEILQKAKLSSTEFIDAITASLEKLPKVTGGAQNSFENFSDAANRALTAIGNTLLPMVTRALEKIIPVLESIADNFGKLHPVIQSAFGGLAVGGAIMGPALLGLAALANSIKGINTLITGGALGKLLGMAGKGGLVTGAAVGVGALLHNRFSARPSDSSVAMQNQQTRDEAIRNAARLGPAQEAMVRRMFAEQDAGGGVRGPISPAEHAAEMSRRSGLLRTNAVVPGNSPRMNAAEMAAENERRKKAAEDAKRIAKERAEVMRQFAIDKAAFQDKFKGQRTEAFLDFQDAQSKFGPGEAASGPYRLRLAEIERAEKEERKRLEEAHQRKLTDLKRRNRELEARALDGIQSLAQSMKNQAESIASTIGATRKGLTKDDDDIANIIAVSEREMAAAFARGVADQGAWLNGFTNSMVASADSIASTITTTLANAGALVQRQQMSQPYLQGLKSSFVGMANSIAGMVRSPQEVRDRQSRERNASFQRAQDRIRNSFGGILGQEIGFEFVDGFARSLEKAFGSNSIGKIFARALSRWMDGFVQGIVDRTLGGLAGQIGGGGGIGSILGGLGKIFGFADGGWVPGPIGRAQPAVVHGGEFVVSRKMMESGMGGGTTINLGGVTIAGDYDVDRMMDRISWHTKRRNAVNPGTF